MLDFAKKKMLEKLLISAFSSPPNSWAIDDVWELVPSKVDGVLCKNQAQLGDSMTTLTTYDEPLPMRGGRSWILDGKIAEQSSDPQKFAFRVT